MNVEYDAIFYFFEEQNEAHAKKKNNIDMISITFFASI